MWLTKVKNANVGFFPPFFDQVRSSGSVLQWLHLSEWEPQSQQEVVPLEEIDTDHLQ